MPFGYIRPGMASISRTYRPQTFAEITGQDAAKETLRREVETDAVGHAYLFSGPRGVGKTTAARVFAKALNCLKPKNGEPCNACDACDEMNQGRALDIVEMDAASHTGVDMVREAIVEHVRFVPHARKHKVYILDEAHMLSTSAWNALLKTLEEPPPYAVFILVTTELHKVPATIQSRCQRFDFRRIADDQLAERIRTLSKKENVALEEAVVSTIVSKADGSLRDAESLLGQLVALGEKTITSDVAGLVLPLSRLPVAADLLTEWSKRDLGASLSLIGALEEQGVPILPLFDDLIQAVRRLLIAEDSVEERQRLARGDEGEKRIAALVSAFDPAELTDVALVLMERRRDAKQGADARFCLELAASAVALGILPHGPGRRDEDTDRLPKNEPPAAPKPPVPEPPTASTPTKKTGSTLSSGGSLKLSDVQSAWAAFLKTLDEKSRSLTFVLKLARPVALEDGVLTVEFQYPFHREKVLNDMKTKRMIEECFEQVLKERVEIAGIVGNGDARTDPKPATMVDTILKAFEGNVVGEGGAAA